MMNRLNDSAWRHDLSEPIINWRSQKYVDFHARKLHQSSVVACREREGGRNELSLRSYEKFDNNLISKLIKIFSNRNWDWEDLVIFSLAIMTLRTWSIFKIQSPSWKAKWRFHSRFNSSVEHKMELIFFKDWNFWYHFTVGLCYSVEATILSQNMFQFLAWNEFMFSLLQFVI